MIREDGTSTIETKRDGPVLTVRETESGITAHCTDDSVTLMLDGEIGFVFSLNYLGTIHDVLSRALSETAVPAQ